jgi:hypothetical protein
MRKASTCFAVIVTALLWLSVSNPLKSESIVMDSANAQNGNYKETGQGKPLPLTYAEFTNKLISSTPIETPSSLLVTKVIRCVSDLGIPSDEAVCKFVLGNVFPSQFTVTVAGNKSAPSVFQGSINGTSVPIYPGNYTVSETLFDTRNIENLLGETTTGSVSTTALGDCNGQFDNMGNFQNATGTILNGDNQKCEIINTIEITAGETPQRP